MGCVNPFSFFSSRLFRYSVSFLGIIIYDGPGFGIRCGSAVVEVVSIWQGGCEELQGFEGDADDDFGWMGRSPVRVVVMVGGWVVDLLMTLISRTLINSKQAILHDAIYGRFSDFTSWQGAMKAKLFLAFRGLTFSSWLLLFSFFCAAS